MWKRGTRKEYLERRNSVQVSICEYKKLRAKMVALECLLLNEDLDVWGRTETWWNGDNRCNLVILGYNLYRKDRDQWVGRGIYLYVTEGIGWIP